MPLAYISIIIGLAMLISCIRKTTNSVQVELIRSLDTLIIQNNYRNDSLCWNWEIPNDNELVRYLNEFDTLSSYEWNHCHANYDCAIKGTLVINQEQYEFELNAGGWIHLIGKDEMFLSTKNPEDTLSFVSIYYCENDWD